MKKFNIIGLILLFSGVFILFFFGLIEFFNDSSVPLIIRAGIISIILGLIIILVSLFWERLKDKNL